MESKITSSASHFYYRLIRFEEQKADKCATSSAQNCKIKATQQMILIKIGENAVFSQLVYHFQPLEDNDIVTE